MFPFKPLLQRSVELVVSKRNTWKLASDIKLDSSTRLFIFDPGYVQPGGHHSEFNNAICGEAVRRGFALELVVNAEARFDNQHKYLTRPIFRVSPYSSNP